MLLSKKNIPGYLIWFRFTLGILIPLIVVFIPGDTSIIISILIGIGFFADIFDGIIARSLNVSTQELRILDSVVDRIFWLLVLWTVYYLHSSFIGSKKVGLTIVLSLELLIHFISLVRFKKLASAHNLATKLWGIFIAISLTEIILTGASYTFDIMIFLGLVSRIDTLIIYLMLKRWDHDIPTCYHAYQLRIGNKIKRNKLFNG